MTDDDLTLIKLPKVLALVAMSRSSVYKAMRAGNFPRPVALSARARGWRLIDVRQWIHDRPPAR